MKTSVLILSVAVLLAPSPSHSQACCAHESDALPGSVVPPVDSEAWASVRILDCRGHCREDDSEVHTARVSYGNLDSDPIGADIHWGQVGQNGEIALTLFDRYFESGASVDVFLESEVCESMGNLSLYFVLKTVNHPAGVARGQMRTRCWSPVERSSWGRIRTGYR